MGEVADMMLGGELCEGCGVWLEGEADGIPRYCTIQCAKDRGAGIAQVVESGQRKANRVWTPAPKKPKEQCAICKAWIKSVGMKDHQRDKHQIGIEVKL